MHVITHDNPVIPLRPGDGRAEPDLLVGWLLVEYIGSECGNGDVQNTSLEEQNGLVTFHNLYAMPIEGLMQAKKDRKKEDEEDQDREKYNI